MTPSLEELEKLAKAATQGTRGTGSFVEKGIGSVFFYLEDTGKKLGRVFNNGDWEQEMNDAAFIAAANPAVVLGLIARIRGLEKSLEYCKTQTGLDDPEFGNFRPLQFAARLGLIDQECRKSFSEFGERKGER